MKRLLMVDDDVESLAVARAHLADDEIEISCATDGRAGLEAAKSQHPDLILLDLDMPGFEVYRMLEADAELCMIPVLFLSGSGTPDDKVRGLDLGAADYITKPFDDFELRARAAIRTKQFQDLLIEHSHIDPLTGLPNRRALVDRLQMKWARMQRMEEGCRSSWPMLTFSSGLTTPTATASVTKCSKRWPGPSPDNAEKAIYQHVMGARSLRSRFRMGGVRRNSPRRTLPPGGREGQPVG